MPSREISLQPSTIETVDQALFNLIDEEFNLHTRTNSGFKKVPVLWIFPERSFNVKNKEIRDTVGKLKLPLITVERASFEKDPSFKGGYQANLFADTSGPFGYRKHQRVVKKEIAQGPTRKQAAAGANETYGQHHYPAKNTIVVYEETYMPIPVWINATYTITLRTEYQQQMNDLMTPFMTTTGQINSFVMRRNGHLYEAFIDQGFTHNNNVSSLGEDERTFISEITIKVLGYLIGDGKSDDRPIVRIDENVVEYQFPSESTVPVGNIKLLND